MNIPNNFFFISPGNSTCSLFGTPGNSISSSPFFLWNSLLFGYAILWHSSPGSFLIFQPQAQLLMNYIVVKQECKEYLQEQKGRRISFDRLLKIAKGPCIMTYCSLEKNIKFTYCSFSYSNFLVPYIIVYHFHQKTVQKPFFLVLYLLI